jgi:hypothetical protein
MERVIFALLASILIIACNSPVESEQVESRIIAVWSEAIHNSDGSHTVTAWMDIEGEGEWWIAINISTFAYPPQLPSLPLQSEKGRVSQIFEVDNDSWAYCGQEYVIYGYHGATESIWGVLP